MEYYIFGSYGLVLVLLVFYLIMYRKTQFLQSRYNAFMQGENGLSLEGTLREIHKEVQNVNKEVAENRQRMREMATTLDTAIRGVGVMRFNAFQDTGSDLSFAVAYLDAKKNGVVISSIYGREESRTYAKPLVEGLSQYQLSTEEEEAIMRAVSSLQSVSNSRPQRDQ